MNVNPPSDDQMKQIVFMVQQATNPMANLTETQKAEYDLLQLIHQSFKVETALRRMADLSEHEATMSRTKAEVFAGGVIGSLQDTGLIEFDTRIAQLHAIHVVAHFFDFYERYLEQGEV